MYRFILYEMYLERGCSPRESSLYAKLDGVHTEGTFWAKTNTSVKWDTDVEFSTRLASVSITSRL